MALCAIAQRAHGYAFCIAKCNTIFRRKHRGCAAIAGGYELNIRVLLLALKPGRISNTQAQMHSVSAYLGFPLQFLHIEELLEELLPRARKLLKTLQREE